MNSGSRPEKSALDDVNGDYTRPEDLDPPSKAGRLAVTVVVLSVIAFWIYALGPWRPMGNPDSLDGQAYAASADQICTEAKQRIDELPHASTATSPADRADVVEEANLILGTMIADLENQVDPDITAHDQVILDKWFSDWNLFLGDRQLHVERLRTEGDIAFEVSRVEGSSVAGRIDAFSNVNSEACTIPLDL